MGCSNNGHEQPTAEQAKEFLEEYETTATTEGPVISSAYWIASNFITHDSQVVAADYGKRYTLKGLEESRKAASFDDIAVDPLDRRALNLIKNGFTSNFIFGHSHNVFECRTWRRFYLLSFTFNLEYPLFYFSCNCTFLQYNCRFRKLF